MTKEIMWAFKLNDTGAFMYVYSSKVYVRAMMALNEYSDEDGEIVRVIVKEV